MKHPRRLLTALATIFAVIGALTLRRIFALSLIGAVAVMLILPAPVEAQLGILQAIQAVLDVINGLIQDALDLIFGVITSIRTFYEEFIWPVSLIERAKGVVAHIISQFRGLIESIYNIGVSSARLPDPVALEALMRNRQTSDMAALAEAYVATYGGAPDARDADPIDRDLMDMDDAMALNTLKMLKAADRSADLILQAANQIEDEAAEAAPGSAPFLTAAGTVANLQSQALIQKMIAAQLRQEAARLAHENTLRKRSGMMVSQFRRDVTNLLNKR